MNSTGDPRPQYELRTPILPEPQRGLGLLPPPSALDLWFDMEGFPFYPGGLEYLFGAVSEEKGAPVFHDWWAHNEQEEKRAFEGFMDFAYARWQQDPKMHVYHYGAYEKTALRRLMGKYATRENEVDELLRHDVLVDLLNVVRQGVVIGTPSYSLKDVERLYMEERDGGRDERRRLRGGLPGVGRQRRVAGLERVAALARDPGLQPGGLRVHVEAERVAGQASGGRGHPVFRPPWSSVRGWLRPRCPGADVAGPPARAPSPAELVAGATPRGCRGSQRTRCRAR